jgi:hypothetical protein
MTSEKRRPKSVPSEVSGLGDGVRAAFCRDVASAGWLFAGLLLAGLSSCNSLLGIGEASLACDTNPCAPDTANAGSGAAGGPASVDEASEEASRAGGVGGASNGDGVAGDSLDLGSAQSRDGVPVEPTAPPGGGASGGAGSNGAVGDAAVPAGNAGAPSESVGGGEGLCESSDDCGACLCDDCESEVAACTEAVGCFEIVACARLNGCSGLDCYCGSASPIACATNGGANGPCLEEALAAPRSRLPTLANPSAGPAADAALEIANCTALNCAASCDD